jgi:CheY-like chemotaxis protein
LQHWQSQQPTVSIEAVTGDRKSVLVVDDDAEVRRVLVQMLVRRGYDVAEASNGKEALAALDDGEPIQVMVTDLVMPEFEGFETIQACRKVRPDIKILAISGAFGGEFLTMALRLGADTTLPKPIRPDVFIETVRGLAARACTQTA